MQRTGAGLLAAQISGEGARLVSADRPILRRIPAPTMTQPLPPHPSALPRRPAAISRRRRSGGARESLTAGRARELRRRLLAGEFDTFAHAEALARVLLQRGVVQR